GIEGEGVLAVGPAMDVDDRRRRAAEAPDARLDDEGVDFPLVEALVGNHPADGKLLRFHAAQEAERDLLGRLCKGPLVAGAALAWLHPQIHHPHIRGPVGIFAQNTEAIFGLIQTDMAEASFNGPPVPFVTWPTHHAQAIAAPLIAQENEAVLG